jgi:hypothetical protein
MKDRTPFPLKLRDRQKGMFMTNSIERAAIGTLTPLEHRPEAGHGLREP